jgi:hypothetical protein
MTPADIPSEKLREDRFIFFVPKKIRAPKTVDKPATDVRRIEKITELCKISILLSSAKL